MSIYTRKGDEGTTRLASGETVDKSDPRLAAEGDLDELNSQLGLCAAVVRERQTDKKRRTAHPRYAELLSSLEQIQRQLFTVGARLNGSSGPDDSGAGIGPGVVADMERWIDAVSEQLPPLQGFLLPGGGEPAARLHLARTICRRTERNVAAAGHTPDDVRVYLNRLSDLLFAMARAANRLDGVDETLSDGTTS